MAQLVVCYQSGNCHPYYNLLPTSNFKEMTLFTDIKVIYRMQPLICFVNLKACTSYMTKDTISLDRVDW